MHPTMIRLYQAIKDLKGIEGNGSQTATANLLSTTSQVVKNWETRGVSKNGIIRASKILNISPEWLQEGVGKMQNTSIIPPTGLIAVKGFKKMNIHERIKQARIERNMTLEELGGKVGVTAQAAQKWEDGSIPRPKRLQEVATALGVTERWLQFGEEGIPPAGLIAVLEDTDTSDTHREIKMYDVELSAGTGNCTWIVREDEPLVFRAAWFKARHLIEENLRGMYVKGDSMSPVLNNRDTVIIDISDVEIVDGEIYAVCYKEKLYIKQAKNTEDGICLLSFNPEYGPMNISGEDAQRFQCLGRMVWRGG